MSNRYGSVAVVVDCISLMLSTIRSDSSPENQSSTPGKYTSTIRIAADAETTGSTTRLASWRAGAIWSIRERIAELVVFHSKRSAEWQLSKSALRDGRQRLPARPMHRGGDLDDRRLPRR